MSVYVDKMKRPYGYMKMCHMLADTLDELHIMAEKIGLKRKWFQPKSYPHYDICLSKKMLALKNGAIEIGMRETVKLMRKERRENK